MNPGRATLKVKATSTRHSCGDAALGWSRGLRVEVGGAGTLAQAGVVLPRGRGSVVLLREFATLGHHQPINHELLDTYPQGQALQRVRQLLVFTKILPERAESLERTELWLDTLLAGQPPQHARIVRPFVTWHLLRRAR